MEGEPSRKRQAESEKYRKGECIKEEFDQW
jgi:hypothetical protein